jgi:hypothetical protein
MALTVTQMTSLLTKYTTCLEAISLGQSYEINGRQMTRANLREVRDTIDWLEKKIDNASDASGGFDLVSIGRQS